MKSKLIVKTTIPFCALLLLSGCISDIGFNGVAEGSIGMFTNTFAQKLAEEVFSILFP